LTSKTGNGVAWALRLLDSVETAEDIWATLRSSTRAAVQADGATLVVLDGDYCFYADEDAMAPLWKGQRFPVRSCISGWSMLHRQTTVIADIRADPRVPQDAYRPTFVRSMVTVPIIADAPVGAIGAYWAHTREPSQVEINTLERLAQAAGRALRRVSTVPRQLSPSDRQHNRVA
jgi:GAF domain-containing protein